ncbi:MAG: hypothetical protein ACXVQW_11210 [Actinomycetota bacterium]
MNQRSRRLSGAVGISLAILYVGVALVSFRSGLVPVRPLYDSGSAPPPYRWVNPPANLKAGNTLPSAGQGTMTITAKGSPAYNLNTDDGQASLIFPPNGVVPKAGETKVNVTITPLDPATVAPPPTGLDYDGNAYRVTATYASSGAPIQIPKVTCDLANANACATVVLRYAFNATGLYLLNGTTWTQVKSQTATAALQIYGVTNQLGTFVAAGPTLPPGQTRKPKSQTGNLIAFIIGLAAILLGTFIARMRAVRRRRARETQKRARGSGKRPKPQKKGKEELRRARDEGEEKPWWRD